MTERTPRRARAVGINHVQIEVDDLDAALDFYGRVVHFTLRGRTESMAFIDLGDQFIAIASSRHQTPDVHRHFGLVVDDREAVIRALDDMGVERLPGRFVDFLDPWGNRVEIVSYDNIQFSKADHVLRGMGMETLTKNAEATRELADKGMAPGPA